MDDFYPVLLNGLLDPNERLAIPENWRHFPVRNPNRAIRDWLRRKQTVRNDHTVCTTSYFADNGSYVRH